MNQAQLHLALNHLPVSATLFGCILLLLGLLRSNSILKQVGLTCFVVSALLTIPVLETGEGAEEIVEHMGLEANIHDYIHEHEEMAETAQLVSFLLGAFSLITLYFQWQKKAFSKWLAIGTFIISLGGLGYLLATAHSGGEIRHTEIREGFVVPEDKRHDD